jgi:lipoate-protein ligase A
MKIFKLGKVNWKESQLIYHALAKMGQEALCLVSPAKPYVCIGFHQDVEKEVDLEFCRANNLPVFRREVGGGAVYLDGDQLFFQLILNKNHSIVPRKISSFYKKFLQPIIAVHHRIGIAAEYKPINDLVVQNRKISGTGAGEIGDCIAFVGNLILDFDYETMSKVLKIPDEKFRDKVKKTIEENLSTICRELGAKEYSKWNEQQLNNLMVDEFEKLLGPMKPVDKDSELVRKMQELESEMINDAWLFRKGKHTDGSIVKVREGLKVVQRMHKAAGGLLKAEFGLVDNRLKDINISGDFFCFPREAISRLEEKLEGCRLREIRSVLIAIYEKREFEYPGIDIDDWMKVLKI